MVRWFVRFSVFPGREQSDIQKRKEWYRNWWFSIAKNYFGSTFNSVFALFGVTEFDFDNAIFATDSGKYKIYKIKFSNTKKCKNGIKSAAKISFRDRKSPISILFFSLLYIILFPTRIFHIFLVSKRSSVLQRVYKLFAIQTVSGISMSIRKHQ